MPKFINIFYIFPIQLNGNITALSQKITSFENTKSEIAASGLGAALGLAASNTWAQIVAKIKSVVNRGTLNWSGSNTTFAVPAGYYPGGTLDSRPSYNNGYNAGVTAADNRANVNSVNYKAGYNAGYNAGVAAGITPVSFTLTETKNEKVVKTLSSAGNNKYNLTLAMSPGSGHEGISFKVSGLSPGKYILLLYSRTDLSISNSRANQYGWNVGIQSGDTDTYNTETTGHPGTGLSKNNTNTFTGIAFDVVSSNAVYMIFWIAAANAKGNVYITNMEIAKINV